MLHIPQTNLFSPSFRTGATQKSMHLLTKNIGEFSGKKSQENGPAGSKKDTTERATGLGRRTREEIAKWNQMTVLRFQTKGDIRHLLMKNIEELSGKSSGEWTSRQKKKD